MLINTENLNALRVGFSAAFQGAFDAMPGKDDYLKVAMPVPSVTGSNVYPWLGALPKMREWVGDRVVQNLSTHDFTLKNKTFESTISVGREEIEDDTFGVHTPMIKQLGGEAATHPNELVFDLLRNGATQLCYDNQYFFDTDHVGYDENGNEISWSNNMGGAGAAWYIISTRMSVKPFIFQKRREYAFDALDKPTDQNVFMRKEYIYGIDARVNAGYALPQLAVMSKQDLTPANYALARAALRNQCKANGKPLGVTADLLVVPTSLEGKGRVILTAEQISGSTNEWKGTAELLDTSWL